MTGRSGGWLLAAVAVLALAACGPKTPKPPASPPLPLAFARTTPDAKVSLTLDKAFRREPGLQQQIYAAGVADLNSFLVQAQGDRAHLLAKHIVTPPYERTVSWTLTAATPRLAAAREAWFDDTGGAHPNHGSKGLIWSVVTDAELPAAELIRPDADQGALDAILCRAVTAAKARRQSPGSAPTDRACPRWGDSAFVPVASTTPGKIGGLMFLFDPYVLGPYAEGDYAIVVPQAEVSRWLAPLYAPEFAGAPAQPAPG